jgi:SAM-dependent methyltransferase
MFNKLVIDSSSSRTDLCELGVVYPTDKSPYNFSSVSGHRHPYTAVYDLLFSPLRHLPINFGEIGIEQNQSMKCWRSYFPQANLWGWEYYPEKIENALMDNLTKVTYLPMDVTSVDSIILNLINSGVTFDVIIDDSTHKFEDQIRIAKVIHKFIRPGGYFVIEDIFRDFPEQKYYEALKEIIPHYQSITFIETEHVNKDSTGWNNDKLLVFVRGV